MFDLIRTAVNKKLSVKGHLLVRGEIRNKNQMVSLVKKPCNRKTRGVLNVVKRNFEVHSLCTKTMYP